MNILASPNVANALIIVSFIKNLLQLNMCTDLLISRWARISVHSKDSLLLAASKKFSIGREGGGEGDCSSLGDDCLASPDP